MGNADADMMARPSALSKEFAFKPDHLEDQQKREAYYIVHVNFDASAIDAEISEQFAPGLPVEAFITTRQRTFLSYVTEPIAKTIMRSMREN